MTKYLYIYIFIVSSIIIACSSAPEEQGTKIDNILNKINGEPVVPRSANKILIHTFKNSTGKFNLPDKILIKIKKSIQKEGRLAIVNGNEDADIELHGRLTSYQLQKIKHDEIGRPKLLRIRVTVSLKLLNIKKNKIIFYEPEMQAFNTFSEIVHPIKTLIQAEEEMLDDLANRITSKTTTGWYTDQMTPIEKGKK